MFGNRVKYAFLTLAVFAMIGYSGCILSPEEEAPEPDPKPTYKPLTEKENIINNLVQCYKEHNIDRYIELLHDDYIWYNQVADDVPEYFDRAEDIEKTGFVFAAAENKYKDPKLWIEMLELQISTGYWTKVEEFEGASCDDCWETQRTYQITARMNGGATTYLGYDFVRFIVMGVQKNGETIYQIRRADDIDKAN